MMTDVPFFISCSIEVHQNFVSKVGNRDEKKILSDHRRDGDSIHDRIDADGM